MNAPARAFVLCAILTHTGTSAIAQVNHYPTPAPIVTAENDAWYLAGDPVMYAGNIYYQAGPQVHFNGNEMVRSGFFHGVPLYVLTTIEPYSKVFVPLSGGLMQPYERRRTGNIAGTVGSTVPAFPVVRSSEREAITGSMAHAAAPPSLIGFHAPYSPVPVAALGEQPAVIETPTVPSEPAAMVPLREPKPNHGLFVDFDGRRWFSTGTPAPLDRTRMSRIGEYHEFPVYADAREPGAIYVPVSTEAGEFVARYTLRRQR